MADVDDFLKKEREDYLNFDEDDILKDLTEEQLNQLNIDLEELDPDVRMR